MRLRTLFLLLALCGFATGFKAPVEGTYQGVGAEAPDAVLPDLQGAKHGFSDGSGAWTLLKFGTTWCPRCAQQVEELNKLSADLQKMGVRVVEVFLKEGPSVVRSELKSSPRSYRGLVLLDETGETIPIYGLSIIPRLFLVDPQGMVRLDSPYLEASKLKQALSKATQKK